MHDTIVSICALICRFRRVGPPCPFAVSVSMCLCVCVFEMPSVSVYDSPAGKPDLKRGDGRRMNPAHFPLRESKIVSGATADLSALYRPPPADDVIVDDEEGVQQLQRVHDVARTVCGWLSMCVSLCVVGLKLPKLLSSCVCLLRSLIVRCLCVCAG